MVLTSVNQDPMIDCMNMLHGAATEITAVIINKKYKKYNKTIYQIKLEPFFFHLWVILWRERHNRVNSAFGTFEYVVLEQFTQTYLLERPYPQNYWISGLFFPKIISQFLDSRVAVLVLVISRI